MTKTNIEKIRFKAGRRDTKFKESIKTLTDRLILKECLKEKLKNTRETKDSKEKDGHLSRNVYSQQGLRKRRKI